VAATIAQRRSASVRLHGSPRETRMSTHVAAARPTGEAIPQPELGLAGKVCLALLTLLGLGALAGGIVLATAPDGSGMGMDVAVLAGSPFPDFLVPGLILAGLFGIGSLLIVAMGLARLTVAPFLAFAIGCAQMVWITVELAIIKEFSVLHPTFFAIGLLIAASAARWGWPTFQRWRAMS
jgi:hypothetical protein